MVGNQGILFLYFLEPTTGKTTAGDAERLLSGKARRFKDVSPENSEDDVEMPSRLFLNILNVYVFPPS